MLREINLHANTYISTGDVFLDLITHKIYVYVLKYIIVFHEQLPFIYINIYEVCDLFKKSNQWTWTPYTSHMHNFKYRGTTENRKDIRAIQYRQDGTRGHETGKSTADFQIFLPRAFTNLNVMTQDKYYKVRQATA